MTLELNGLKEAVSERDRSISQLREQIKYYINFAENSIHGHLDGNPRNTTAEHEEQVEKLVGELQEAKETIRCLTSHNSELRSQLQVVREATPSSEKSTSTEATTGDDVSEASEAPEEGQKTPLVHNGIPPLTPEVALMKLEQKFKEAMTKCVELSSEKEQLEHIIVQLEEETETVG